MKAGRFLVVCLAAGVAFACVSASVAASEQQRARASFTFGIEGGNIVPFTAVISRSGRVTFTRGDRRLKRPPLTVAAVNRLLALAKAERFDSLPASIDCAGALPDMGTQFITIRTAARTRTVHQHGGCNRRFDTLYARLYAAV